MFYNRKTKSEHLAQPSPFTAPAHNYETSAWKRNKTCYETDVFYRGSQEVIGATKMDEKLLDEIRRQEQAAAAPPPEEDTEDTDGEDETVEAVPQSEVAHPTGDTKQTTLFGGDY